MRIVEIVIIIAFIIFGVLLFNLSTYTLDDSTQVVITQFGKVVNFRAEPGTYYKIPIIQKIYYFKKDLFVTKNSQQIPTLDKQFLGIKSSVFWKIKDPVKYYKSVFTYELAQQRILDLVGPAERNIIIQHSIRDIVPDAERIIIKDEPCSIEITKKISDMDSPYLLKFGIEIASIEANITYPGSDHTN